MIKNETEEQRKARFAGYVQKWRIANPEKQKLARKRAYNNRKLRALKMVGEPKCARCGCDEIDFLEYNHIGGGGCKEWRKDGYMSMTDKLITGKRSVDGLEILCRVCNALEFLERKNKKSAERFEIKWN